MPDYLDIYDLRGPETNKSWPYYKSCYTQKNDSSLHLLVDRNAEIQVTSIYSI